MNVLHAIVMLQIRLNYSKWTVFSYFFIPVLQLEHGDFTSKEDTGLSQQKGTLGEIE